MSKSCGVHSSWSTTTAIEIWSSTPSGIQQAATKNQACASMYCEETSHNSADCPRVSTLDGRKKILTEKKLCFNCTGPRHWTVECVSKMSRELCSRRLHTSICNDQCLKGESVMSSLGDDKVVYPVVVVKVGGIECHALLDSGASTCYASAKLLDLLGKQLTDIKPKKIERLMAFATARMEIFKTTVSSRTRGLQLGCQSYWSQLGGASQLGKSQIWTVDQNLLSLEGYGNGWHRCQNIACNACFSRNRGVRPN